MSQVIELAEGRRRIAVQRAFRNWRTQFGEEFGEQTRLADLSLKTLGTLAQGKAQGVFYLYDFIMQLEGLGSGFDFERLAAQQKMAVIDRYLLLLDQVRFECMLRLGWLESYPGQPYPLVEIVARFNRLAPGLMADTPRLSPEHPHYSRYRRLHTLDREGFIRKLIPQAIRKVQELSGAL